MSPKEEQPRIPAEIELPSYALSNFQIRLTEEFVAMFLTSGNIIRRYECHPKHAKRIYLLLKSALEDYEKRYGKIATRLSVPRQTKEKQTPLGFQVKR